MWCSRSLVVLALMLGSGCGGASPDAREDSSTAGATAATAGAQTKLVPTARWVAAMDELCLEVAKDVGRLRVRERSQEIERTTPPGPGRMRKQAPLLDEQLRVVEGYVRDAEQVGLPREHTKVAERILTDSQGAVRQLRRAADALRTADEPAFERAIQRYFTLSTKSARVAALSDFDFEVCGSGVS
jgi:hypothetical protein